MGILRDFSWNLRDHAATLTWPNQRQHRRASPLHAQIRHEAIADRANLFLWV